MTLFECYLFLNRQQNVKRKTEAPSWNETNYNGFYIGINRWCIIIFLCAISCIITNYMIIDEQYLPPATYHGAYWFEFIMPASDLGIDFIRIFEKFTIELNLNRFFVLTRTVYIFNIFINRFVKLFSLFKWRDGKVCTCAFEYLQDNAK